MSKRCNYNTTFWNIIIHPLLELPDNKNIIRTKIKSKITYIHNGFLNKYGIDRKYNILKKIKFDDYTTKNITAIFRQFDRHYIPIKNKFYCDPIINYMNNKIVIHLLLIIKHSKYNNNIIKYLLSNIHFIINL